MIRGPREAPEPLRRSMLLGYSPGRVCQYWAIDLTEKYIQWFRTAAQAEAFLKQVNRWRYEDFGWAPKEE